MTTKLLVANWKMNGTAEMVDQMIPALKNKQAARVDKVEMVICPPFPFIPQTIALLKNTTIACGAQDCHHQPNGAHTGDVSADMLKQMGVKYVIIGHSERRAHHMETDQIVQKKAAMAIKFGLIPIICVGETADQRENQQTLTVLDRQLKNSLPPAANAKNTVIAYEPVWAIGSGKTPSSDDIAAVHQQIKAKTSGDMRVLYGGSLKPDNAAVILKTPGVDGGLIGGASLKEQDFGQICENAV